MRKKLSFSNSIWSFLLLGLGTLVCSSCNNENKPSNSVPSKDSSTSSTAQPLVEYSYHSYSVTEGIFLAIANNTRFQRLWFSPDDEDSGPNVTYRLIPTVDASGSTPIDTTGLLTFTGTVSDLGYLQTPNGNKNYRINRTPARQIDFLKTLLAEDQVTGLTLTPVKRTYSSGDHLAYDIGLIRTAAFPFDTTAFINKVPKEWRLTVQMFRDLLQLNPRPPGSDPE